MSEYISLNEALMLTSKASDCSFSQIRGKRIMFHGMKQNGETVTLCSPQSKMHSQGFYWVDITQEQYRVLSETDTGIIFFRLEGRNLVLVRWEDLKQHLTSDCMRNNTNEGNHWKLNIYHDHIKVSGNDKIMPSELCHYPLEKQENCQ